MANVTVKFNGKEFLLSCDDGQEDHLEELSNVLNNRFDELKSSLGNIGENKLLIITSIKIMDEYYETRKKINKKKEELENLTKKFKELKSLVYDYKDKTDSQISQLVNDQLELKEEIDKSKTEYEKIIDNAATHIENFVKKINTDKSVQ
tara:strand:- start:2184 stop:2630 length:447 start_codon:yes stop_codon:yes gene_type:complete